MIKYHGTPIGGKTEDAAKFLNNRHALVSFAYPNDIGVVADVCSSFILDNGAFTTWKTGKEFDKNKYYEFVEKWMYHPGFDWALIPDVIDGTEIDNNNLLIEWPFKNKGIPIWHYDESLSRLTSLSDKFSTIALGSSGEWSQPNSKKWWERTTEIMNYICDDYGRPHVKLHGLRMLDPRVFKKIPLSSADSTNAAVNSGNIERFGMYKPPSRAQRAEIIANRIECNNSSPVWIEPEKQMYFDFN